MTQFRSYHTSDRPIPTLNYVKDQTARVQIPKGHRYTHLDGKLSVTLTHGGGAAATVAAQAGIMALISGMFVQINGGEEKWSTSGNELFVNSIELTRNTPTGLGVIDLDSTATYTAYFQYRFDERTLVEHEQFALDLLTVPGNGDPFTSHDLVVKWGSAASIFDTVGDMTVTAATLEFDAEERRLIAGQPYTRSNEIVHRKITKPFTAAGDLRIELPRIDGTRLISMAVRQTYKGAKSDFLNIDEEITLYHEEYKWKNRKIWKARELQNMIVGSDVPDNIVFMPVVENGLLRSAKHNNELDDELELVVPVNMDGGAGGSTADHQVEVFLRYAKAFALT